MGLPLDRSSCTFDWAAIPVNRENQIDARAPGRARIDLLLVPAVRHLVVDLVHVPAEPAREIAVAHRGRAIRSRSAAASARGITVPVCSPYCAGLSGCGGGWCGCVFGVVCSCGFTCLPRIGIAFSSTCFLFLRARRRRRLARLLRRQHILVHRLIVGQAAAHCSPGSPASIRPRPGCPRGCDERARPAAVEDQRCNHKPVQHKRADRRPAIGSGVSSRSRCSPLPEHCSCSRLSMLSSARP